MRRGGLTAFHRGSIVAMGLFLALVLAPRPAMAQGVHENLKINEAGFTSSLVCGKCHSQIYERWKNSMHANSTSDPIFRASYMEAHYKSEGKAAKICLKCHAPTTKFTHEYNFDVNPTSEGLTCDFCHSLKDVDLDNEEFPFSVEFGLVKYGPNKRGDVKQHKVAQSPLFGQARLCASCHEYRINGVGVMTTYSEWKDSAYAEEDKQCQYCHMPEIKGEISNEVVGERGPKVFSHDLAGGHSLTQLKKALALKITGVERQKDRLSVKVSVTNIGSGHRMPTGIPTRKLILYCEVRAPGGKVYKDRIVYEKVIFDKDGYELTSDSDIMLGYGSSVAKDNRIFPKETRNETFTFYIPDNKKASVSVWADYLYSPVILQETEMRVEMNRDSMMSAPKGGQ